MKITGYRDLTQQEIDLMNRIKQQGTALDALVGEVRKHLASAPALPHETDQALNPQRWASMATTDFQTALMFLTRAVARPSSF